MSPPNSILVVEDDTAVGTVLAAQLRQAGYEARCVPSGNDAMHALGTRHVDLVITDLRMPGMDGMELLRRVRAEWSDVPVVMITAHGNVPVAVEAMKAGATDFVSKPFNQEEILYVVDKALRLRQDDPPPAPGTDAGAYVSTEPAMREVLDLVQRAAKGSATVLLRGESGTGKTWLARAIHQISPRASGPFVEVHCGALPDQLIESELFGYEKGAFTGATQRKVGRVEFAAGGTLFLDEIGDVSAAVQVKLLRLLSEKRFERLGATATLTADVRFVAATHRPLEDMIARGEFREDLFYRLNVIPIYVPPLRERRGDIERLAVRFCDHARREAGNRNSVLDPRAIELLIAQPWPGNVRQLQSFVSRLVVLSDDRILSVDDVQRELARTPIRSPTVPQTTGIPGAALPTAAPGSPSESVPAPDAGLGPQLREAEKKAILDALGKCAGNRTKAARLLGISRRTLYNKIDEYGIS